MWISTSLPAVMRWLGTAAGSETVWPGLAGNCKPTWIPVRPPVLLERDPDFFRQEQQSARRADLDRQLHMRIKKSAGAPMEHGHALELHAVLEPPFRRVRAGTRRRRRRRAHLELAPALVQRAARLGGALERVEDLVVRDLERLALRVDACADADDAQLAARFDGYAQAWIEGIRRRAGGAKGISVDAQICTEEAPKAQKFQRIKWQFGGLMREIKTMSNGDDCRKELSPSE
ncbi:hypothetical protein GGX14DRAFT_397716 [Mycena pura]|uniref:Uncharacterized protein n=1 Tax=Mycena pura TaxID=153505 RepID=A0AAD6V7W1_9AGAR|nr:hypothetical protein GGX14DRAFT_397716 [Mycena pura]